MLISRRCISMRTRRLILDDKKLVLYMPHKPSNFGICCDILKTSSLPEAANLLQDSRTPLRAPLKGILQSLWVFLSTQDILSVLNADRLGELNRHVANLCNPLGLSMCFRDERLLKTSSAKYHPGFVGT